MQAHCFCNFFCIIFNISHHESFLTIIFFLTIVVYFVYTDTRNTILICIANHGVIANNKNLRNKKKSVKY